MTHRANCYTMKKPTDQISYWLKGKLNDLPTVWLANKRIVYLLHVSATSQVSNKLTKWVINKLADNLISKKIQILTKEPYDKVTRWLNDKLTKWLITKGPSNVLIFQITDSSNEKLSKARSELLTNWLINWPTKVTDWLINWLTD